MNGQVPLAGQDYNWIISAEGFARICAGFTGSDQHRAGLELAANMYRALRAKELAGTQRGVKADLRLLKRKITGARTAIESVQVSHVALIGAASTLTACPDLRPNARLKKMMDDILWLETSIDAALGLGNPAIRLPPESLFVTVCLLAPLWRRWSGAKITHSAHRNGVYRGGARSPFGSFVVAFFAEVDPAVHATKLGNIIREHRAELQKMPLSPDD